MDFIELMRLIMAINRAAPVASRNKRECKKLAFDVTVIAGWLLLLLRHDREVGMLLQELMPGLAGALREAQEVVAACCWRRSPWRAALELLAAACGAGETPARRLRAVQGMVDRCVEAIPLTLEVLRWVSNRRRRRDERPSDASHGNDGGLPALASATG